MGANPTTPTNCRGFRGSCLHLSCVSHYIQLCKQDPHWLVSLHLQLQETKALGSPPEPLRFVHAAAEDTGLPSRSYDLVSICLVCHELPQVG